MDRHFRFDAVWVVPAPRAAVRQVLGDLAHYPDWWPEVVAVARSGPQSARVLIRSRLPYTLDLELTSVRQDPDVVETRLDNDLVGWARWSLTDLGQRTLVEYEQQVDLGRSGFDLLVPLLRPAMVWNHTQMMRSATRGLSARAAEVG